MEAYSSFSNFMNFKRSAIEVGSVYKRYALLFDQVIFNRHGCPVGRGEVFETLPGFIANLAENDRVKASTLGRNKRFGELFIDLWDVVETPVKVDKDARNYVSVEDGNKISTFSWGRNLIDQEMGIDNNRKEYKAAAIVAGDILSDLSYNFYLADRFSEFRINLAPVIGDALETSLHTSNISELFDSGLIIPKFEDLTWDQILELRGDKYIQEFRRKVFACSDGSQPIDMVLSNELEKDLWSLANDCKPNLAATLIEGFLSNLPLPSPVNPFGWYYAAKSIARDCRRGKEKGWVYFVQSMRKLS